MMKLHLQIDEFHSCVSISSRMQFLCDVLLMKPCYNEVKMYWCSILWEPESY